MTISGIGSLKTLLSFAGIAVTKDGQIKINNVDYKVDESTLTHIIETIPYIGGKIVSILKSNGVDLKTIIAKVGADEPLPDDMSEKLKESIKEIKNIQDDGKVQEYITTVIDFLMAMQGTPNISQIILKARALVPGIVISRMPQFFTRGFAMLIAFIPVIVMWIIMVVVMAKMIKAREKGKIIQMQCGGEYLERETQRYVIYKDYDKVKGLFPVVNIMLVVAILFIFLYIAVEHGAIYFVADKLNKMKNSFDQGNSNQQAADPKSIYQEYSMLYTMPYYIFHFVFIVLVVSLALTVIGKTNNRNALKYSTPINESELKDIMRTMISFMAIYIFVLMVLYGVFNITSSIAPLVGLLIFLTVVLYIFNKKYIDFNNKMFVAYSKAASDVNTFVTQQLADTTTKDKARSYLFNQIRRANPNIIGTPDLTKEPYKSDLFSYLMHKNGAETFDETGLLDSVNISTFKSRFVKGFFTNEIDEDVDATTFTTTLNNITNTLNSTEIKDIKPEIGYFNLLIRKYLVEYIYTPEQRNGVVSRDTIVAVLTQYNKTDLLSRFDDHDYTIFDEQYNTTYRKSCYRVLQEAVLNGNVLNYEQADDIINILLLANTQYDYLSVNLSTVIKAIEDTKDTLSTENVVGLYTVLNKLQDLIKTYQQVNSNDIKLQEKTQTLRNLDVPMKLELNKMIGFIFWINVSILIFAGYMLFHKIYTNNKPAVSTWLPLMTIIGVGGVVIYAWVMGNLAM